MRLIDAEGSELQTQLKIICEAEYQIYGSGSWGFTAKCEHAIEDAPTVQPEPHWIPCSERLPEKEGYYLITKECLGFVGVDTRYYYTERDSGYWSLYENGTVIAWMPLPEPYKGVTE